MPSRDIHRPVGAVAGAGYSAYHAHRRYRRHPAPAVPVVAETIGGFVSGWLGGALPDWIDPPTSPNHRNFGHGIATVAGAVAWTADFVLDLQEKLRAQADSLEANRWRLQSDAERTLSALAELFLRLFAGMLNGLIAGYASHLVLDMCTPSGLPLVARGY
jgi:hypothetical protein